MKYVKIKSYYADEEPIRGGTESTKRNEPRRSYSQYLDDGYSIRPSGNLKFIKSLYPAVYKVDNDMQGIFFITHDLNTDDLLRFEDDRQNTVLNEVKNFWKLEDNFKKLGFVHKRGILLYGDPGTGKSCILKLVVEHIVKEGDIAFVIKTPHLFVDAIHQIRQVEPNRRILAIMEDVDEMCQYNERELLGLFDGDSQHDNIVILGTTNYIDKLPPRMLRTGRFDRVIEIGNPGAEGRRTYFNKKLLEIEYPEVIEYLVDRTEGFNFSQLKEVIVSVYCLGYNVEKTIKRILTGPEQISPEKEKKLDSKIKSLTEEDIIQARIKNLK